MNFKDLQFSIGKFTTAAFSNVARKNPLQNQDTRALSNWIFEERNELYVMRMLTYHHSETYKAMEGWINEESPVSNAEDDMDLKHIGSALLALLSQQSTIEEDYAANYQKYRAMLKAVREREDRSTTGRDKPRSFQSRFDNLTRANSKQPNTSGGAQDDDMELGDFKRFGLREAFYIRFNAIQEMAEKLAIIAGYGQYIVDLIDIEPTPTGQFRRRPFEKVGEVDQILTDALATLEAWSPAVGTERPTVPETFGMFAAPTEEHKDRPPSANSRTPPLPPRRPNTAPSQGVTSSIPDAEIRHYKPDVPTEHPEQQQPAPPPPPPPPPAYYWNGASSPPNSDEPPVRRDGPAEPPHEHQTVQQYYEPAHSHQENTLSYPHTPNSYTNHVPPFGATAASVNQAQAAPPTVYEGGYTQSAQQQPMYLAPHNQKPNVPIEDGGFNPIGPGSAIYDYPRLYRQVTLNQLHMPQKIPYNQFQQHYQRLNAHDS